MSAFASPLALVLAQEVEEEHHFEAHHWWWPETIEIIWGGLAFLIVAFVLWKFAVPALKGMSQARTERIAAELERAANAKAEAERSAAEVQASLANIADESTRIIEEARRTAEAMKAEQLARLDAELEEMRSRAAADIEASRARAIADLQASVAELAVGAAEAVVRRNLDHETQVALVERYIAEVGSQAR